MTKPGQPSLSETMKLIVGLRFKVFLRRISGNRGLIGMFVGALFAISCAFALSIGSYLLFSSVKALVRNPVWMAFSLSLFTFLLALFWVIWPVVAAQVDEAYELGRFLLFPVSPRRMYGIQTLVSLVEPSVLFFYPALIGASVGLSKTLHPGPGPTIALVVAFCVMNVAVGRFLVNLFLNIMTSRRSGEILFAFLLVLLMLAALLPPIDASWLFARLGGFGTSPEDLDLLAATAHALGATPPGLLARGLAASSAGETNGVVFSIFFMLVFSAIALGLGMVLVLRFYRGGRGIRFLQKRQSKQNKRSAGWKLPFFSETFSAVLEKEFKILLSNPKAQLAFAVPFFLLIIIKIIGGAQVFLYLWEDRWAAYAWTLLGLYILSVAGGQLFVNSFGYENRGIHWLYWTPAPLESWVKARNVAHSAFVSAQMLGLGIMLFVLMPGIKPCLIFLPISTFVFALFVLLGVGNLLSLRYPKRFHYMLAQRDHIPAPSFGWVLVCLAGCALVAILTLVVGGQGIRLAFSFSILPLVGIVVYRILFSIALQRIYAEKEHLIQAIAQ